MERIQVPIKYFNVALDIASPAAGLDPAASMAFGIVRSVTTLAVGVCGVEGRLNSQIKQMLEQIKVIDECDALGQKIDTGTNIHQALVAVYKDLLAFNYAVVHVLMKKSTVLAMLSEQFNERVPPVVDDFLRHTSLLYDHIRNATSEIIKSIQDRLIENACPWVIKQQAFRTWYASRDSRFLALFGNMGCGKTATMSFIIEEIRGVANNIPSPLICYHYCRDSETGNSLYAYSSLIQQLMRQKPQLKATGKFLLDSARKLERPLFVFLDGLDECEDKSLEELATSFRQHAASIPNLWVCVSSRYQEDIRDHLKVVPEILMQADHQRDRIIVSHMVQNQLPFLNDNSNTIDFVIDRLSELANGSAIWVQMAVDFLAKRKTRARPKIQSFLHYELPNSKLSDLYAKLFSQVTEDDTENQKVLSDALEVLASAERPPSILELGWAVALRDSEADVNTVQDLAEFVDSKRVLGLLSPFITAVAFEAQKSHQVRLAHQSVREFVFQAQPSQWSQLQRGARVSIETIDQRRSELHDDFVRSCVRYLLMEDLVDKELFSQEQDAEQAFDQLPGYIALDEEDDDEDEAAAASDPDSAESVFDPSDRGFGEFFTYASCYWPSHLRKAEQASRLKLSDVVALTTMDPLKPVNWWEQFKRPGCTLTPDRSQPRPESLNPVTMISFYGPESLLVEYWQMVVESNPAPPVRAWTRAAKVDILGQGDVSRLPRIIRYNKDQDLQQAMDLFGDVMGHWWLKRDRPPPSEDLIEFNAVFDHMEGAIDIMVLFAAAADNPRLKQEMLRPTQRDDGSKEYVVSHQFVGNAVWNGRANVVAYLLEQDGIEAHLKYRDFRGNSVFHKAAHLADMETLELLVSRFPEGVDEHNALDDTPLRLLIFNRRAHAVALVKFLLEVGKADARCGNTGPGEWFEPLRMATRYGDIDMCRTLVEVGGVDPLSVFQRSEDDGQLHFIDPLDYAHEDKATEMQKPFWRSARHGKHRSSHVLSPTAIAIFQ